MGVLRTVALVGAAGLMAGPAAPSARAQAGATGGALVFEQVGDQPISASDLAFDGEAALWAIRTDVWRLAPGASAWEEVAEPSAHHILPLGSDTLLLGGTNSIRRSVNGGQTFVEVFEEGEALFEAPVAGTLLTGIGIGSGVAYSSDRGATWVMGALNSGTWVPIAEAFAELPPGHPHAGRLVAGCWGGLAYSDDGGQTWQKSNLWEDGGRYLVRSVAVGMDGRVYATVLEAKVAGTRIAASADGGATYEIAYDFGVAIGSVVRLVALPGGADPSVGVLIEVEMDGSVWRSDDGAESFRRVGEVPFLYPLSHLQDVAVDEGGRLYVAAAVPAPEDGEWVYRTVEPVVSASAVETEAEPVNPPVVIPLGGGNFAFTVQLTNTTTVPMTFEAWSAAAGPLTVSPVLGPRAVTLPPGASVTRTLTQRVPGNAPPGTYTYAVNVGDFPGAVLSSDSFTVVKEGTSVIVGGAGSEGWAVSEWGAMAEDPPEAVRLSVLPNPFRSEAAVTLTLAEPAEVTVGVYDVLGRRVALLHEDARSSGPHAFRLNGRGLPAGVYVVRATAGGTVATRTVTRLR
jgi:hypothetical protein